MFVVEVYVSNASLYVNQLFSYYYSDKITEYCRVNVEFSHRKVMAFVINCFEIEDKDVFELEKRFKLSPILNIIDNEPIIDKRQFEMAAWLSRTTFSPFVACLNTMLPKALRTAVKKENIRYDKLIKLNNIDYQFTDRQKEIYDLLYDGMSYSDALKLSNSIIRKFIENYIISIYEVEHSYLLNENRNKLKKKELTADQRKVYDSLINSSNQRFLLFGVTGSGKTEVYLQLAEYYLAKGLDVLILVPEIALTPQMIERVCGRFDDVVFYHSALNDNQRYEQYMLVKKGKSHIAVGTRSAIFLPFQNLGLIIVDEEHDTSYKQENTPCYQVKNVALKIAADQKAKVLFASATPSLDTYAHALKGDYDLLRLDKRINEHFPAIDIVDLTKETKKNKSYIISTSLKNELDICLNNHKQAFILLNRRGYVPLIRCGDCGITLMCNDCDIALTYHQDENVLKCHQCGRVYQMPKICPKCQGSNLISYGFGTKKVEEELKKYYPDKKIVRMDRDSVSKKDDYENILNSLANYEIDILIGTQMIAKGLDYPDVTLVGILNGDAGLMRQDYNSCKLTFDLLMQASGRSGRAENEGKVLIQVFNPDHFVLRAVKKQDYQYFYNIEMNLRSKTSYPPYSHLLEFIVSDLKPERIDYSINFLNNLLLNKDFKIYKALQLPRINGLYRSRIIVASRHTNILLDECWKIVDLYLKDHSLAKLKVDLDPLYIER